MIIAVDIDEVIAETLPAFLLHYNCKYQTRLAPEDFKTSDWGANLLLAQQQVDNEISEFIHSPFYRRLIPVRDSIEVLTELGEKNSLHVVTSRWGELRKTTKSWLTAHFPDVFDEIHYARTSHANVVQDRATRKSDLCKEIGASIMIEDCPLHAADCAENGISVILYDRPWNKNFSDSGVRRADSWKSVIEHVGLSRI